MIELEDFGALAEPHGDPKKEEPRTHDTELFYRQKIEALQEELAKRLESERKESYKQGFEKAMQEASVIYSKRIQEEMESFKAAKEKEYAEAKSRFLEIGGAIRDKLKEHLAHLERILLDNILELLEFLYIDEKNSPHVERAIREILAEFQNATNTQIRVGKAIGRFLEEQGLEAAIIQDVALGANDFIIQFSDIHIENRITEKLKVLRDEIEREIKKTA